MRRGSTVGIERRVELERRLVFLDRAERFSPLLQQLSGRISLMGPQEKKGVEDRYGEDASETDASGAPRVQESSGGMRSTWPG